MARSELTVEVTDGNLGRRNPTQDMVSAIVMNGVATADIALGAIIELRSIQELEALGCTAAYDETNKVLVHHHISRVFLRNPSAILHIMLLDQSITLTEMVDKDNNYVAKLLREKNGDIVQWAVARNPIDSYTPTLLNGLDTDVVSAISKAQELIALEATQFRYSDCFIEGRSFNGTATAALDLRTNDAKNVSVVIGADKTISEAQTIYNGYAAVGDVLGLQSLATVSQNFGEQTQTFNLTDETNNIFVIAGLSSNIVLSDYTDTALNTLHDKGYIYADATPGLSGYWFNDTSCCIELASDFAYKENNRTINKAIKLARQALLPILKSRIYVDPNTGRITLQDAKSLETIAKRAIQPMLEAGDLSGGIDAFVNPDQNLLSDSNLDIELAFVPVSIARQIKLKIGFTNPLN